MLQHHDHARRYRKSIQSILLNEWDPIGVAEVPEAHDEYDSYVGPIYAMLIKDVAHHTLVDYLWWVETEHIGLVGDRRRTEAIADRLLRLRDEMEAGDR